VRENKGCNKAWRLDLKTSFWGRVVFPALNFVLCQAFGRRCRVFFFIIIISIIQPDGKLTASSIQYALSCVSGGGWTCSQRSHSGLSCVEPSGLPGGGGGANSPYPHPENCTHLKIERNPWLGGFRPQVSVITSHCSQMNLLTSSPPSEKIGVYATGWTLGTLTAVLVIVVVVVVAVIMTMEAIYWGWKEIAKYCKKVIVINDEGQWMTFGKKEVSLPSDNLL
jgi:hypothetical protein